MFCPTFQFDGHTEQLKQLYAKVYEQNECLRKVAEKLKETNPAKSKASSGAAASGDLGELF